MPHNAYVNYAIGNLLDNSGHSSEALPYLKTALECRAEFPEALNSLGLCLVNLGHNQEAVNCYRKAVFPQSRVCGEDM